VPKAEFVGPQIRAGHVLIVDDDSDMRGPAALDEAKIRSLFADYDMFLAKPKDSCRLATAVTELLKDRPLRQRRPARH